MQDILRKFKPEKLEDLVALNALYRPGPMDCIPQYIEGKWKPETIHYPDPSLEDLLKETYGVMVYQEQIMKVAQIIAGFSLGGADMLRRAMGKKKPEVLMGKKKDFVEGAIKKGHSEKHAEEIFDIMVPFAGYGFNKSHAAAYSVLAYRTGWLKAHRPAEFMAANLTNEITSTDGLPFYLEEARKMGVPVDPPDVNRSDVVFDVVNGRIVFGLKGIKGMGDTAAKAIVAEREANGPYKNFMDFLKRIGVKTDEDGKVLINKKAIEVLIKTGAFDNTGKEDGTYLNRVTLLHNMEGAVSYANSLLADERKGQESLFGDFSEEELSYTEFEFERIDDVPTMQILNMEKECIGCYVSGNPLDDYKKAIAKAVTLKSSTLQYAAAEANAEKAQLEAQGISPWQRRDSGKSYIALGMLSSLHVIRTKKGDEMAFAKLVDYEGEIDCTFFPKTWGVLRNQLEDGGIYAFKGKVDGSRGTPSLLVDSIEDAKALENRSVESVHILLSPDFSTEAAISDLKNFLFDETGNCSVYFHVDTGKNPYVIKANNQLHMAADDETIAKLKSVGCVQDVWLE